MFNEYAILFDCAVRPADVCDLTKLYNLDELKLLVSLGFLVHPVGTNLFFITPAGRDRLLALHAQRENLSLLAKQQADHDAKEQARLDDQQFFARRENGKNRRNQVVCVLLGAALTLLIEHGPQLVHFLQQLPQR